MSRIEYILRLELPSTYWNMSESSQLRSSGREEASEVTPLLVTAGETPLVQKANGDVTPLDPSSAVRPDTHADDQAADQIPKAQVFFLCFARLYEPIAFFAIFPFINQMIYDTAEVPKTDVGFYSGLIESIFSLTQVMVMIPWGRLADHPRVGRKPVLVISTIGTSICTLLFGTSKTIWQMFLFRCSAGVFAGTLVTIRTMLAENSTKETQARIFSWFAVSGNLGIFVGPLLGGALSDPVHQYPGVFGGIRFFEDYPYALATFVCGGLGLIAALTTMVFVKETLKVEPPPAEVTSIESANNPTPDQGMSILELVQAPGVAMVLFLQSHIMLLAFAFTAVMPVFYFTPIKYGGFGMSPVQISLLMAIGGLAQALWMLLAFPWIQKHYSTGTVIRACARAWPFFFLAFPMLSVVLRQGWSLAFWIIGPILLALGSGVAMAFAAIQLAINDVNPKPSTLGTLNSLALALSSAIRAFSPGLFTAIFAVGVRNQIVGGYLVWVILIVLAAAYTADCQLLPANAEGKLSKKPSEQENAA